MTWTNERYDENTRGYEAISGENVRYEKYLPAIQNYFYILAIYASNWFIDMCKVYLNLF